MIVLFYFDWFGSAEELREVDDNVKKACTETEGVEYRGRYTPNQKKFHWTYLIKAGSFAEWEKAWNKLSEYPRDYMKLPHGTIEFLPGPYHE
jgi:hypothetical protein